MDSGSPNCEPLPQKSFSFSPGFSLVHRVKLRPTKTVSTVFSSLPCETVGNGFYQYLSSITGLKPGVNETTFRAKPSCDLFFPEPEEEFWILNEPAVSGFECGLGPVAGLQLSENVRYVILYCAFGKE